MVKTAAQSQALYPLLLFIQLKLWWCVQ